MIDDTTDDAGDDSAGPKPRKLHGRLPGLATIAAVVAIAALAVAAWSIWRLQHFTHAERAARKQDTVTIADLQSRLASGQQQAEAGNHRLGNLESGLDDLRSTTRGLDRRIANLETAFNNLSGQQQSGRDTLLLNDAEMLLRTGQQRYGLFHDSVGALKAYSQAIEALAQVQNPAYAAVRASAITERDALAAAAPPSRQGALDSLSALRNKAVSLPLATSRTATAKPSKPGFWSRIGHAFSGIVKVTHENGKAAPLADARFAHQALALDLAQAQEALLAFDSADYHSALQRADATLAAQFETGDTGVKDARAQIANLLAQHSSGTVPQLGGALAQLQSLRANQGLTPPAPASASSSGTRP
ncbi:MAG TPA: uroporphyrinogen-III C-methyltransferase [Rhodanobacteraceae bacterium]|nr:uroporphyrinogen-III C-methyltransferase [Rhodanobacteraceae bacterium]